MARRIALALLVLGPGLASGARADVTEYFGDPGVPAGSTVVSDTITDDAAPVAVEIERDAPEPAPEAPEVEPVAETAEEPMAAPAAIGPDRACPRPVTFERVGDGSHERASIVLVGCDGAPDAESLRELSILARPARVDRPSDEVLAAHEEDRDWVAPRVRRLDAGLLERLRAIADRFPDATIELVSGYRPDARDGSRHRFGRALDLRVEGVAVADLDAFVRTIPGTGCGLYPTTDFIHLDVRSRAAHWVDTSGPGEAPALVREPEAPVETTATPTDEETDDDAELDADDTVV